MQPRRTASYVASSIVFSLIVIVLVSVGIWQRYYIYDQIRLWHYQPSAAVTQLADETTMVQSARRVFYANHPALDDRSTFSGHCTAAEKTIVLGCYVSNQGIYLYDVTDSRLHGVVEVTAAHETLHAEYDRLSPGEKKKVNAMLTAAYAQVTDQRIRDTIKSYQDSGADITNELHSILGTEVRTLPADLENYYRQYFSNRSAIVAFSEQYESEFTNRQQQVAAYDVQLKTMKQQIDESEAALKQQAQQINAAYAQLQELRAQNNIEAYNAGVPSYNKSVSTYNAQVKQVQNLISQYNVIVTRRNAIAVEENQLSQAIDSRPDTLQSQ